MTIGIILAGGKSSRFKNGDKALFLDKNSNQTWTEIAYMKLSALTEKTYIVASHSNLPQIKKQLPSAHIITDHPLFTGEGPLAGLYTVSSIVTDTHDYLILAVDYPEISVQSLTELLSVKNTYIKNNFTIAHLTFSHTQIQDFLENKNRRMQDFLTSIQATSITLPEIELTNHNYQ
ncbi:NTP transferase domain-containing protein [Lactococcus allomyrinae]|uniref:MobA-like NTP transferase domain-containing protein n=1 Tax=Lactococcus allomyrinae TaxID=2419773 RepID=A0A387BSV5_9LACT|nr:NTP transferase domain-containing protein [Lactococcus allomyrinae]AYG01551.1 hypothetical protein D7I46_11045 [Lactococcus allomyrinae]